MNDFNRASQSFKLICYADETALSFSLCSKTNNTKEHKLCSKGNIESSINTELKKIIKWLSLNKLSLNTDKTKFMVFHNRQFQIPNNFIPNLKIN